MPPRYALSVALGDVSTHMKLLTEAARTATVAVHVRLAQDEHGNEIPNMNEVMVVCRDMKSLLTSITVALTSLGQSIVDADIVTTTDGFVVDRFVVSPVDDVELVPFTPVEIKNRIVMQLSSAMGGSSSSLVKAPVDGKDAGEIEEGDDRGINDSEVMKI